MGRFTSAFAIEVFDRRNARSERLADFLLIYVQHFGPEHRTETNELLEFLAAPPSDRTIIYFGLTYNEQPCGFATFMYYPDGPIGIVDHLVIAPNLRGYGAFFGFCDLITGYLERRRLAFDHIVAEVMLNERSLAATIKPMLLVRLMRLVGFRVAKARYWAPDPTIVVDPDRCKAALLFASQPERDELPVSEFLRLVELIYRVHYARWYERTMTAQQFDAYRLAADGLLDKVRTAVGAEREIVLNGMKNLDLPFTLDPTPQANPTALFYIALIAIPAAVGIAVAFAQDLWVAITAAALALLIIALFAGHPRLRRPLLRAFRLAE
jgi:hypothetical protein